MRACRQPRIGRRWRTGTIVAIVAPNSADRRAAVTVERLVDVPELDLRLLSGPARAEINWVHNSDLVDPTPFLAPGNLLLTTGQQFASAAVPEDYLGYVQRLVGVGVRAVGFGTDRDRLESVLNAALPDASLGSAADEAGLADRTFRWFGTP
jgi:hypothetical protein